MMNSISIQSQKSTNTMTSCLITLGLFGIFACGMLVAPQPSFAADDAFIRFSAETIVRGYTGETDDANFRIGVWPGVLAEPASLSLKKLTEIDRPLPTEGKIVSDFYQYDFLRQDNSENPLVLQKPYTLAIRYRGDNAKRKVIQYYDDNKEGWVALPSSTDFTNQYVRAITHLPFSRVAVVEENVMQEGRASYYVHPAYRNERIAASREYASGTILEVINLENNKSVIVTVRDYGPDAAKFPDRIIDISKTAFADLAPLSRGTLPVRVLPLAPKVLGVSTTNSAPTAVQPTVNSTAAIAVDSATGTVLFSKNTDAAMPIASLTKLMTAVVFLETEPSFDSVVTYQAEDNAIGAKLYVSPGETMRVKDLWYSGLVGSANNAVRALARSTGLSEKDFVQRMNDKAKSWGLSHTNFADVTGLDPRNTSTVGEYAIVASKVLKDIRLLQATTMTSYSFSTINTGKAHTIINKNKMLASTWYVTGTKTGYLD
ncbi:MAG: RlpA-like double-psi beta-barrel domain-containing protein, partial [Patescibacteria group bacterium]